MKQDEHRYPGGQECYPCFDTRRKFYKFPMDELNQQRAEDPDKDDEFNKKLDNY